MKKFLAAACIIVATIPANAKQWVLESGDTLHIDYLAKNAIRVRIGSNPLADKYLYGGTVPTVRPSSKHVAYHYDPATGQIAFTTPNGVDIAADHKHSDDKAAVVFKTPVDEHQYGTGQFQDGYLDIKGLSRRLTQVNTQISVPMFISNKGYGILWNNCGATDFNPTDITYTLTPVEGDGEAVSVDVTGTEGNAKEERRYNAFRCTIDIPEEGDYALLLDVGQQMARKHYLEIDGWVVTQADNVWLPPTVSAIRHLKAGEHKVEVRGEKNDRPTLSLRRIDDTTTFSSDDGYVDYTVFAGTADEIVATMRELTGQVPMLPKWALGYVHCRERYTSQDDILQNAARFRAEQIPIDVIVQDWQWWGDNGWNAMVFDSKHYPDPKALTDSLHAMDVKMMLSVWAKVDKNSVLGHQLDADGRYIPGTDWIDFFSEQAAEDYWQAYRANLVPTGIDSWWQDATEPENDDLHHRRVRAGTLDGDKVRNIFPLVVNDRVYRGLCEERPGQRTLILTRSAAPGLQRYGAFTWSGDVGNDWQTLRRQIAGGLGQMATGLPWWTYDAGGFFRPQNQYKDKAYQDRMVRWIQTAVFLPMMRVHGYMSQTEPWHYDTDTYQKFVSAINSRYLLLPYLYSEASRVSREGYTLMRPLVFDFPDDEKALSHDTQYMLGSSLLVCPVTCDAPAMEVYLPDVKGGWYDLGSGDKICGTGSREITLDEWHIPVFVKAGSILPMNADRPQCTSDVDASETLWIVIYPGNDGSLDLYDDNGTDMECLKGDYTLIPMQWDDAARTLTIGKNHGKSNKYKRNINIRLANGDPIEVTYEGKKIKISL